MIGIQSLWTGTTCFRITRELALLYTASTCYLNRAFPSTELVTDFKGLRIADLLGWEFTSITTALQDRIPNELRHVWMLGKIIAQQIQTHPFAHIDLDIWLYQAFPNRILNAPVAAQSKDALEAYCSIEQKSLMAAASCPDFVMPYNTGVIAWNDMDFKNDYCEAILDKVGWIGRDFENGSQVTIVVEQAVLAHMARRRRVRVEECVQLPANMVGNPAGQMAADVKLTHFWGRSKHDPNWQQLFMQRFLLDFPERFAKCQDGYDRLIELGIVEA